MSSAEVINIDSGEPDKNKEMDIESQIALALLSEETASFIEKQAEASGVSPSELIDNAVLSYKNFCELVDDGGTLFVRDKDGHLHQISSDESESPPAA